MSQISWFSNPVTFYTIINYVKLFFFDWTREADCLEYFFLTSSRSSYCSMSFLSFSASSMFSCLSLVLWVLCCSICISISLRVIWKWSVASLRLSSYSLNRWAFSSYQTKQGCRPLTLHIALLLAITEPILVWMSINPQSAQEWCSTLRVLLCRCSSLQRLSSLLRARIALLCSLWRWIFSLRTCVCFFCSTFTCFCILRLSSSCQSKRFGYVSNIFYVNPSTIITAVYHIVRPHN